MKKITDYKDEIHKCSKCGLCQSVCPVYEITGNDCAVSRGKFIMLNGIIKGDLKLNKNVNKYLDMCLKCNACKNFCPSGIDARKIFLAAKEEYFNNAANSKFIRILNSPPVFKTFMNLVKFSANTYRFLKLDKLVRYFYPMLLKMGKFGKKIILANELVIYPPPQPSPLSLASLRRQAHTLRTLAVRFVKGGGSIPLTSHLSPLTVIYFKGCVNEYINPRVKNATENILKQMGTEILNPHLPLECCGVPFLSCGNAEQFKKQAEFNLSQIPEDFDFFLTDCASCQNAFREYKNYIEDEKLLKKLDKILKKSMNVVDFIVKNAKSFEFEEKTSFTFHKPCHLENMDFLKEFLKKSKNVEYIEMKDFDKCCGFSGEFAVKNSELSQAISAQKAQNAISTNADYILTSCPACILGLEQGIIENNPSTFQPFNLSTFVEFILGAKIIT
ncbi:MAG: (Fe-S)-binding protein [Candidatus Gastranaerophilaceae bacterium]